MQPYLATPDPRDQFAKPLDVASLVETVVESLGNQRVVRDLDRIGQVLLAGDLFRERRGEQVVGLHALNRVGNLAACAHARDRE